MYFLRIRHCEEPEATWQSLLYLSKKMGQLAFAGVFFLCGCAQHHDIKSMSFSGTMELTEHVLGAKVAGRLATLTVDEGDIVHKGQLLGTLDRFEQSKKDYDRVGVLLTNGGANQQSL